MIAVEVKFVGGCQKDVGTSLLTRPFADDATIADLDHYLKGLGLDLESGRVIAVLNGKGLSQWPETRFLQEGDQVVILPQVAGGQARPYPVDDSAELNAVRRSSNTARAAPAASTTARSTFLGQEGSKPREDKPGEDAMTETQGFAHLAINVKDWDKSMWFYGDLLGLPLSKPVDMGMGFSLTYADLPQGGRIELFRNERELPDRPHKDEDCVGFRHSAFSVVDLASLRDRLASAGVKLVLDQTDLPPLGVRVILVEDPNGVVLEFAERLPG